MNERELFAIVKNKIKLPDNSEIMEFKTSNEGFALQIVTRQLRSPLLQYVIEGHILNKFGVIDNYFDEEEEYIINAHITYSLLYDLGYVNNNTEYEFEEFDVEHYHYDTLSLTDELDDYIKSDELLTYIYDQGPDLGIDEDLYQQFEEEYLPGISKVIEL